MVLPSRYFLQGLDRPCQIFPFRNDLKELVGSGL